MNSSIIELLHAIREEAPGSTHTVTFHTENMQGDKSGEISYTALTKPEAPKQVGYHSTKTSVIMDFTESGSIGADLYIIERNGVEIGRTSVTSATYEDRSLVPGVTYSYEIKTIIDSGVSDGGFRFQTTTLPVAMVTPPMSEQVSSNSTELSERQILPTFQEPQAHGKMKAS
ncbi:hypothetical protein NLX71_24845 [Paenibacillus sp. MZ04-78.2]|nr:hypothetical protein [Paenibacillus sp. MZ04-78.2]